VILGELMAICTQCRGEQHVCARPGCGHHRMTHRGFVSECSWSQAHSGTTCNCESYIEAEAEKLCREEKEKEQWWPVHALHMLITLKPYLATSVGYPEHELDELIKRGRRIITQVDVSLD